MTWIGNSGNWNTASNWDTGSLPAATDDAIIAKPGIQVTHTSGNHTVKSLLTSNSSFIHSGGTLVVSSTLSGNGDFQIRGGYLQNAHVTNEMTIRAFTGRLTNLSVDGALDLASPIEPSSVEVTLGLTLNGTAHLGDAGGLKYGQFRFLGSATQTLDGSGTIILGSNYNNAVDVSFGTLTIDAGITIRGSTGYIGGYNNGANSFINWGTIHADAGGEFRIDPQVWNNNGAIRTSNGGALDLDGKWTNWSTIEADTGAIRR